MVLNAVVTFVVSLFFLIKGADYFVEAAGRMATFFRISVMLVGLTVVAVGTSLPELVIGIVSSLEGNSSLVLGNVLGANAANLGLILGMSAMMGIMNIKRKIYSRDGLFMMAVSLLFLMTSLDGALGFGDGLLFLAFFSFYLYHLWTTEQHQDVTFLHHVEKVWVLINPRTYTTLLDKTLQGDTYRDWWARYKTYRVNGEGESRQWGLLVKDMGTLAVSGFVVFMAAQYLVPAVGEVAVFLGVPSVFVAAVLLSLGTTMPEMAVSLVAIRKGMGDLVVGNVVGSNIADLMLVGGVAAVIAPIPVGSFALTYLIPSMLFFAALFLAFVRANWVLRLFHGLIFVLCYLLYVVFAFLLA